jgi:hypothetical protein
VNNSQIEHDLCKLFTNNILNKKLKDIINSDVIYYSDWINVPDEFGCIHHTEFNTNNIDTTLKPSSGDLIIDKNWLKNNLYQPFILTNQMYKLMDKRNELNNYIVLLKAK